MKRLFKILGICLVSSPAGFSVAYAQIPDEILSIDTISANIDYIVQELGAPYKVDEYSKKKRYKYGNCEIAFQGEQKVEKIEVGSTCNFQLKRFVYNWKGDTRPSDITVGDLTDYFGRSFGMEGCFSGCGNAADPVNSFTFEGSRADGFVTVTANVIINEDASIDATSRITDFVDSQGREYDYDLADYDDSTTRRAVYDAFKDVKISSFTIGGGLPENMGPISAEAVLVSPKPVPKGERSSVEPSTQVYTEVSNLPRPTKKIIECRAEAISRIEEFPAYLESQLAGGASEIAIFKLDYSIAKTDAKISSCQSQTFKFERSLADGSTKLSEQDQSNSLAALESTIYDYENTLVAWALLKELYQSVNY